MKNPYKKGARLERRTKKRLEDDGYLVIRSAGSHGPVDLVCFKGVEPVRLVQVKANFSEVAAMKELKRIRKLFHEYAPIDVEVWSYYDGCPEPHIYP